MKFIKDFTKTKYHEHEGTFTYLNFTCSSVKRLTNTIFNIKGETFDGNYKVDFIVDRSFIGTAYLFAPGYVFNILYQDQSTENPSNKIYFIAGIRMYYTKADCKAGAEDIHMFPNSQEEKKFLSTPYNTVNYFEEQTIARKKKYEH
jgi:hypothetical protein